MNLIGKRPTFREVKPRSNIYRMILWLILITGGVWVLRALNSGQITPLFLPTPTPTRTSQSYALEGQAHFTAGNLNKAIAAYKQAVTFEPNNAELYAELARIEAYSSNLLTTDVERKQRLQEALDHANLAVEQAPDDSMVYAIRAFVLDWNASLAGEERVNYLTQAEQDAVRALQLDNQNTLALAYYAEILVDQQKWLQAQQYIKQAAARDPTLMDVHRVYAYVLESLGDYGSAIDEYKAAAEITPNLTFLYISIGVGYRHLQLYDLALEYFAKAASLDEQLGIKDPVPYISIAKTYTQQGEFFIAARNINKAISFDPSNPDTYGQLGIVYFKSRNYEGSIPVFKCALYGCTAEESCAARNCDESEAQSAVVGMDVSANTVAYYYTYGSVLAGLSRRDRNYCPEANEIFSRGRAGFSADPAIMSIVEAGEQICTNLAASLAASPTPSRTPKPTLITGTPPTPAGTPTKTPLPATPTPTRSATSTSTPTPGLTRTPMLESTGAPQ